MSPALLDAFDLDLELIAEAPAGTAATGPAAVVTDLCSIGCTDTCTCNPITGRPCACED